MRRERSVRGASTLAKLGSACLLAGEGSGIGLSGSFEVVARVAAAKAAGKPD